MHPTRKYSTGHRPSLYRRSDIVTEASEESLWKSTEARMTSSISGVNQRVESTVWPEESPSRKAAFYPCPEPTVWKPRDYELEAAERQWRGEVSLGSINSEYASLRNSRPPSICSSCGMVHQEQLPPDTWPNDGTIEQRPSTATEDAVTTQQERVIFREVQNDPNYQLQNVRYERLPSLTDEKITAAQRE